MQISPCSLFRSTFLVALASCSGEQAPPSTAKSPSRPPPRAQLANVLPSHAAPVEEPKSSGSRGLLAWVPSDALFVVRAPHIENLGEIRRRTSFGALMQNPAVLMALSAPDQPLGQMMQKLHTELPELEHLFDLLPELKGDLVLGLTRIGMPARKMPGEHTPEYTFALAFDAQSGADKLQAAIEPLLVRLENDASCKVHRIDGGLGLAGEHDGAFFEIRSVGKVFTAVIGSDPKLGGRMQAPAKDGSTFANNVLVHSSADLDAEGHGVFEMYLNAGPAWKLVDANAPADVRDVLTQLGLFDVKGCVMAMGLGKKGMAETHTWMAPAHKDIVSHAIAGKPANRELARWIPEDATTAGLYSFDLGALFECIANVVPPKERPQMETAFAQIKQGTGIDLVADVFQNLGPSFAMVSRGDPLAFMTGPSGLCLMIETRDAEKAKHLLERIMPLLPPNLRSRTTQVAGHEVRTLDVRALGMPIPGVSWCQVDGALMIATDDKLLERCLEAGAQPGVKQAALAQALAGEGVIGANLTAANGDLPATLSVVRKTDAGLTVSTPDGSGMMGAGLMTMGPIMASVAIPRLLSARLEANEKAAAATLWAVASAEAQCQSSGIVDVDGDGVGEYGFLGEMNGTTPIRGTTEVVNPVLLSQSPPTGADGIWSRSGYHFIVYLPTPKNGAISESKTRNGRDVATDDAEIHWIAYAWPDRAGQTGNRVYMLDQEGDMMCCERAGGKYSGLEQRPSFNAAWPVKKGVDRGDGKPYQGGDGSTWQMVPYPRR
jgi:hypothetical protein